MPSECPKAYTCRKDDQNMFFRKSKYLKIENGLDDCNDISLKDTIHVTQMWVGAPVTQSMVHKCETHNIYMFVLLNSLGCFGYLFDQSFFTIDR